MNNEQQQIIGEAYENYCNNVDEGTFSRKWLKLEESFDGFFTNENYSLYTQEEFINKCKTDSEFSEKWGLKIEERELSLEEREKLAIDKYPRLNEIPYGALVDMQPFTNEFGDSLNIPTRLITITYKEQTITSYE